MHRHEGDLVVLARPRARRCRRPTRRSAPSAESRVAGTGVERQRDLGGDAVRESRRRHWASRPRRDRCASSWLADFATKRTRPGRGLAGDQPDLGRLADLDAGELALGRLRPPPASDRARRCCAISVPVNENAACPTSAGTSVMTPTHGARTTPRSRSASAAASAASAALYCASRLTEVELRQRAASRSAALGLELGLALVSTAPAPARPAPRAPRRRARQ